MPRPRCSPIAALLGAAAVAASGHAAEAPGPQASQPLAPSDLGSRTVSFVYEAHASAPPGTKVLELWMPLPREDDQTLLAL